MWKLHYVESQQQNQTLCPTSESGVSAIVLLPKTLQERAGWTEKFVAEWLWNITLHISEAMLTILRLYPYFPSEGSIKLDLIFMLS